MNTAELSAIGGLHHRFYRVTEAFHTLLKVLEYLDTTPFFSLIESQGVNFLLQLLTLFTARGEDKLTAAKAVIALCNSFLCGVEVLEQKLMLGIQRLKGAVLLGNRRSNYIASGNYLFNCGFSRNQSNTLIRRFDRKSVKQEVELLDLSRETIAIADKSKELIVGLIQESANLLDLGGFSGNFCILLRDIGRNGSTAVLDVLNVGLNALNSFVIVEYGVVFDRNLGVNLGSGFIKLGRLGARILGGRADTHRLIGR